MKKFKRIFAIVMTLAMVMSLGIGLTASAVGETADIVINVPMSSSLTLTGMPFAAYRIFDVEISTNTAGEIEGYVYKLNPAYSGFLATYSSTYGSTASDFIDFIEKAGTDSDELNQLTLDLIEFIDTNTIAPNAIATGAAKSVTFPSVLYGYYLVTGDGKEAKSMHILITVPGEDMDGMPANATKTIKADAPTIDKEVWFHNTGDPNGNPAPTTPGWQDWTDVSIGDNVYFKHESKVPNMFGYDRYWFIVHDSMSPGLTLDETSFAITVGGITLSGKVTDDREDVSTFGLYNYIVVVDSAEYPGYGGGYTGATNFAIYFDPDVFIDFTIGDDIIITYNATLNDDAVIGLDGNPNIVYLEYSNNPHETGNGDYNDEPGDTGKTTEDEVWVYTFDFEIYKYTGVLDGSEKALPGAEFELRTSESIAATAITFIELNVGSATVPAQYRVATEEEITENVGITKTLITPEFGKIHIDGLDAGKYYLIETESPTGYNKLEGAVVVDIIFDHSTPEYTVKQDGTATDSVNVENNTGTIFPDTGGIGRTIFIFVGLTLMVGAIVTLTVRRKVAKVRN